MDKEFDPLKGDLSECGIDLNPMAAAEHVPEIEQSNCVVKERVRGVYCTLPYASGVSPTLSPRAIITGTVLIVKRHCCIPFGAYAQTHEEGSNSVETEGTLGAICLGPVGNIQGSYKFMSLRTGKLVIRQDFDELPATTAVIRRVAQLAEVQNAVDEPIFYDRNQVSIPDLEVEDNIDDATLTGVDDTNDGNHGDGYDSIPDDSNTAGGSNDTKPNDNDGSTKADDDGDDAIE
eukprot:12345736-Ditylum_brightwellii.AAC.1